MKGGKFMARVPIFIVATLLASGCASNTQIVAPRNQPSPTEQSVTLKADNVITGKLLGISQKAMTVTVESPKGPVLIKFDGDTNGLRYLQEGSVVIITFNTSGKDKIATDIEPKLAKLPEGVSELQPDALAELVAIGPEKGNYILVDARPAIGYAMGHIPTAISIPVDSMKADGKNLLPLDNMNKPLIFYCGGFTCDMSSKAAGLAAKIGFKNISVMLAGFPGWEQSGHYLVAANSFIEKGNIILLDLRTAEEAAAGHVARAVNIPFAKLNDTQDEFPSSKAAPIVLYGNGDDSEKARKIIKGWGYKNVALMNGGITGWRTAGNKLVTGPAADEIHWVRKLGKGEVSKAEFQKALEGKTNHTAILDVRTNDEANDGKFPGAIHIPLDEIESRLAELPKDKELLIYCTSGARAEMAHHALQNAQIKSRFLMAVIECEKGKCEMEE